MQTKIYYNNVQVLSGQPTPLVSREDSMVLYGERWAEQVSITLKGQITGCPLEFDGLLFEQERLVDIFSKDFQPFYIEQSGAILYSGDYVQIPSIKFPSSKYVGIVEYEVTLQCYPSDLFSGVFGVLEPEDSWDFQETEDGRFRATHTISARGFNTSSQNSNALQNAQSFVQARSGNFGSVNPYFIDVGVGLSPCLKTVKEDVNRFNGTYRLTEFYEADLFYNEDGILRFSTDFECSPLDGISRVSINGEILGCRSSSILDVRNRYNNFDIFGTALDTYQDITSLTNLNPEYLKSGVTEDPRLPKISFELEFDNFTGNNIFFNYRSTVSSGDNDNIGVAIDGQIGARGDLQTRWGRVNDYYSNNLNLFGLAESAYSSFVGGGYPIDLNPIVLSSGTTFNSFSAEIRVNASWDNRQIPVTGFSFLDYTLDFQPSIQKVSSTPLLTNNSGPICEDEYYVVDLGYKNRVLFGINGNGKIDCDSTIDTAIANLKSFANLQFSTYCPTTRAYLETHQITTGVGSISFNFAWSAESNFNVLVPKVNYEDIATLSLK